MIWRVTHHRHCAAERSEERHTRRRVGEQSHFSRPCWRCICGVARDRSGSVRELFRRELLSIHGGGRERRSRQLARPVEETQTERWDRRPTLFRWKACLRQSLTSVRILPSVCPARRSDVGRGVLFPGEIHVFEELEQPRGHEYGRNTVLPIAPDVPKAKARSGSGRVRNQRALNPYLGEPVRRRRLPRGTWFVRTAGAGSANVRILSLG